MNNIISAFKTQANPDRETFYLFLVPGFSDDLAGFMPLGRNFGFIASGNASNIANTMAHELGHGAFVLYHPFSEKSPYYRPEGSTDNLMDYSDGTFLNKYQWDLIHDPRRIVRVAQDEGEGASLVSNLDNLATWSELFPELNETELGFMQRVYDTVGSNYDALHSASISQNVLLSGDLNKWSIRKSSHSSADRVESVAKNIATNTSPSYSSVDTNEIYVKKYEYRELTFMLGQLLDETKSTNVALYSYVDKISFTKTVLESLENLKDEARIKVGSFNFSSNVSNNRTMTIGGGDNSQSSNPDAVSTYVALPEIPSYTYEINDYVLIAFYSNEGSNPDFVFQLIPDESESEYEVAAWLTHIGVLEQESEVTLLDGTIIGDPVPNPVITPVGDDVYKGKMGCTRIGAGCTNAYSNYTTGTYPDMTGEREKKHTGIDITAEVGTNIHAIYGGRVCRIVDSFDPQNTLYATNQGHDVQGLSAFEPFVGDSATTIGVNNYFSIINYEDPRDTTIRFTYKRGMNGCHYAGGTVNNDITAYGNYVIIETTNLINDTVTTITGETASKIYIRYAHMNEVLVSEGQIIPKGGIIGTSGCSGNAARIARSRFHIHIEAGTGLYNKNIDPINLLNTEIE